MLCGSSRLCRRVDCQRTHPSAKREPFILFRMLISRSSNKPARGETFQSQRKCCQPRMRSMLHQPCTRTCLLSVPCSSMISRTLPLAVQIYPRLRWFLDSSSRYTFAMQYLHQTVKQLIPANCYPLRGWEEPYIHGLGHFSSWRDRRGGPSKSG